MKRLLHPVVVGLLGALLVSALAAWTRLRPDGPLAWFDTPEYQLLDLRLQWRGGRPPGPEVAIVVLDDKTAQLDQALIERRGGMARLVRAIHIAGARVIGLDLFIFEPEQPIAPELSRDVLAFLDRCGEGCPDDEAVELLRRLRPELRGDTELIEAFKEAGNVVLALRARSGLRGRAPEGLGKGRYGQTVGGAAPVSADEVTSSLPAFNEAAARLGFVSVEEGPGVVLREIDAARMVGDANLVPFGVQIAAAYLGAPRAQVVYDGANRRVMLDERSFAFEPDGAILLNPRGPEQTFPTYSAVDVVQGKVPPGLLKGRIVLVGITQLGVDRANTSLGAQIPGVEINATLVDNVLRGDPLHRAQWGLDALACLALGLLISLFFWPGLFPGPLFQVGASVLAWTGYLAASWLALTRGGVWLSWTWPSLATLLCLGGCLSLSYATEGRQRRTLRRAFTHYLADEVIREFEKSGRELQLGGERRVLTALFSDIRGFTTLCERLDALQLVRLLNTHLGAMTGAVLAQGGLLNKYIGDALMAFFGAPVPHADHSERALAATLSMHRELAALNAGAFAQMGITVRVGVGLNTGEMVVGNMGSEKRFDYTILGDAVNLASRLESLTKTYGVFCLVGPATRAAASATYRFREVDLVQVKGKTEAVAIHELLSGPGREIARYQGLDGFAEAMAAWRAGQFASAKALFAAFAAENPQDRVAQLFLERLAAMGEVAPAGWTGVVALATK